MHLGNSVIGMYQQDRSENLHKLEREL
jgi:hypothetical protein